MNLTNPIHSEVGIAVWVWHALWGVTILLVVVAVLAATARHRPTVRHGLWLGALIGALGLPVLIGLVDGLGWSPVSMRIVIPSGLSGALQAGPATGARLHSHANLAEPGAEEQLVPFGKARVEPGMVASATGEHRAKSSVSTQVSASTVEPAFIWGRVFWTLGLLAWGLGSLFLGFRWAVGGWQLKRLLKEGQVPPSGWRLTELQQVREALSLSGLPPIRLCRRARMPMVAGLRLPRVILPQALATKMSPAEFTDTLIHECAHIRRRDQWVLALQRVALVAFWPHPLIHFLNRELERAREELCDNHVLTASRPTAYAETLLRLAQVCLPVPKWGSNLAMLGCRTLLEERIRSLVDKRRERDLTLRSCEKLFLHVTSDCASFFSWLTKANSRSLNAALITASFT